MFKRSRKSPLNFLPPFLKALFATQLLTLPQTRNKYEKEDEKSHTTKEDQNIREKSKATDLQK